MPSLAHDCSDDDCAAELPVAATEYLEGMAVNSYVEVFDEEDSDVRGPALLLLQAVVDDTDVHCDHPDFLGQCFMPLGMPDDAMSHILDSTPLLVM